MILTRYIVEKEGKDIGIARITGSQDYNLEDAILFEEEYLHVPCPYPSNSLAYFTEIGVENHSNLIKLWIKRADNMGYKVLKKVINLNTDKKFLYQDDDQILIERN